MTYFFATLRNVEGEPVTRKGRPLDLREMSHRERERSQADGMGDRRLFAKSLCSYRTDSLSKRATCCR